MGVGTTSFPGPSEVYRVAPTVSYVNLKIRRRLSGHSIFSRFLQNSLLRIIPFESEAPFIYERLCLQDLIFTLYKELGFPAHLQ